MRKKVRNIDWSRFALDFDEEGNPVIKRRLNGTIIPTHLINGRYLAITTPETNNILFHRAVWFLNEIANGRKTPDYYVEIHHKDGNTLNCRPENLEALTMEEHIKHHFENGGIKSKWKNDTAWREKMLGILANNREKLNKDRKPHARRGPNMGIRAKWQDPVWREKMLKVLAKNREGWKMKKQNKQTQTEE